MQTFKFKKTKLNKKNKYLTIIFSINAIILSLLPPLMIPSGIPNLIAMIIMILATSEILLLKKIDKNDHLIKEIEQEIKYLKELEEVEKKNSKKIEDKIIDDYDYVFSNQSIKTKEKVKVKKIK